jgi:hypothetical protein
MNILGHETIPSVMMEPDQRAVHWFIACVTTSFLRKLITRQGGVSTPNTDMSH